MTVRADLAVATEVLAEVGGHPPQLVVQTGAVVDVARERLLLRDRDPRHVGLEPARVDAAGAVAKHAADLAGQQSAKRVVVERGEGADGLDSDAREALGASRPHPRQLPNLEWTEERALFSRQHDGDPARLAPSDATFATTFDDATPSEHVSRVVPRTAVCTASASSRARRKSGTTSPRSR